MASQRPENPIPTHPLTGCGVGLRREHFATILSERPAVPWFEAITENFMVSGGRPRAVLEQVRRDYPIALHGVSLSLGSAEPLDPHHLRQLTQLVAQVQPAIVSDHLCWTTLGGHNSHDLLPLPRIEAAVRTVARKIDAVQAALGRRILIENVSTYVELTASSMTEWEFLTAVVEAADCEILLDVNNVYVNARNHGFDARQFLDGIPAARVRQMHLAGHEDHGDWIIDTHDHPVVDPVWDLYAYAIDRFGPVPTLIERDANIPPLAELLVEAGRAERVMEAHDAVLER